MKILAVNQSYNNKSQKINQAKGNTNFGAVLVKSNFELFGYKKSLAEKLLDIAFSIPSKLTAFANKTRGNKQNIVAQPFTSEAKNPTRIQEVYLSDEQERKFDDALAAAREAIKHDQDGKDWGLTEHYGKVTSRLWDLPKGPVRELRNLAEKLFAEAEKNPIEHVVTACVERLAKANEKVGDAHYANNTDLYAALNGRRFPEQLELPFPKEKPKRAIRFASGEMFDPSSPLRLWG